MQAFRQSNFRHHNTHAPEPQRSGHRVIWLTLLAVIVATGGYVLVGHGQAKKASSEASKTHAQTTQATTAPVGNACAVGTDAGKYILVSISERHLWACDGTALAYNSAVVTGMESLAADLTPPGTYHIYAKSTNLYLKGHDSTGSWNDYVNYFMPFLDDKYGIYGFHDATWRPADAFGNVDPNSSNASHGCVETPLATAKWLYDWAAIGTTVTIES